MNEVYGSNEDLNLISNNNHTHRSNKHNTSFNDNNSISDQDNDINEKEEIKEADDDYINTIDINKLNLDRINDEDDDENKNNNNNDDGYNNISTRDAIDLESQNQINRDESKLINDNNRTTIISNDESVASNYDQNEIDLKELMSSNNEDNDKYTSNDNPAINSFIEEAIKFGANALDLSKKNLFAVPRVLFKLDALQYLYLESNKITELPINFFTIFGQLKWLDLRNNQITHLPLKGLANHENLRYLLLENNLIKKLPVEIAYIPNLTALNLINNPLEFPPIEVLNKGIKHVKEFLKENSDHKPEDFVKKVPKSEEPNIFSVNDDIWASDEEDEKNTSKRPSSSTKTRKSTGTNVSIKKLVEKPGIVGEKTTLERLPTKLLITQQLQPANEANNDLKHRLYRAKSDANNFSKSLQRKRLMPIFDQKNKNDYAVYKNHALEKAIKNGKTEKYRKLKEKTDSQLQKVKDQAYVEDFRDEMKEEQRKLLYKRLVKGVDYEEPVRHAPFDIDEDYIMIMTKEERERLDQRLIYEKTRSLSPETLWKIEEERRLRDHALQEKIREYTKKLLEKREAPKGAPKKDRLEAAKDLRELRALEKELQQRQREIQFGFNAYSGDLRYRETAKINNAAKASNFLPNKFK